MAALFTPWHIEGTHETNVGTCLCIWDTEETLVALVPPVFNYGTSIQRQIAEAIVTAANADC